jgi:predicted RNase H-like nuclease (RuvC/YqgF family)
MPLLEERDQLYRQLQSAQLRLAHAKETVAVLQRRASEKSVKTQGAAEAGKQQMATLTTDLMAALETIADLKAQLRQRDESEQQTDLYAAGYVFMCSFV